MNPKRFALGLIAALLIAGCAEMRQPATKETLISASATVVSVDQATRDVTLTDNADGTSFTVNAGPEVRNLPQLAAGDQVQIDYYQGTTLSMAAPTDSGAPQTAVVAGTAPEGAKPGGAALVTRSMVVTVVSYNRTRASRSSARRTASPAAPWSRRTCAASPPSRAPVPASSSP